MKNYTEQHRSKWKELTLNPPPLFYGSSSGAFRIFPGNPKDCSTGKSFDPRLRPWFVTGPKRIVIILDTSKSTGYHYINKLKEYVTLVIDTLSLSDYVSLITCSDVEQLRSTSKFERATNDVKNRLRDRLNNITVDGGGNFELCFNEAFDVMQKNEELIAGSQKAIMFFTDGLKTTSESSNEASLIESINKQVIFYKKHNMKPPVFFTYSISTESQLPKAIACKTNGFWRVIDVDNKWETLSPYFKYFSMGLSDSQNQEFVAWVEPYYFASGQGLGTSVSAPVYDKSVDPPVLEGVVTIDITKAALQKASGVQNDDIFFSVIQEWVNQSVAKYSNIQLDDCQMESLRYHVDYNATCSNLCTNITNFGVKECTNVSYPEFTLNNNNLSDKTYTYEKRACCHVNSRNIVMGSSDVCIDLMFPPENKTYYEESSNLVSSALLYSLGVLGFLVLLTVAFFIYRQKEHVNKRNSRDPLCALPGNM